MMNRKTAFPYLLALLLLLSGCRSHYQVVSVQRTRIVVDSRYDVNPDAAATAFLQPYKQVVDSIMGPVVGQSAKYMTAQRPEGTLSNLLGDILVWASKSYGETVDFGLYNIGGVRADLPQGNVTYGDVLDIAPFENKIAFVTLQGSVVQELFRQIISVGGEGVSHSVRMVGNKQFQLVSATIDGQQVDPNRDYRVVTIDYLLEGNDKMLAFKKGTKVHSPQDDSNNLRFIIMDYFREQMQKGILVDREIEGRVTFKQ